MPAFEPGDRKRAFDPVADGATRVLILGSLPGETSLRAGEYYAHPRNGFWRLMGGLLGEPALDLQPYPTRLALLRKHGVGLWDVIAEADRIGSLDTSIRLPTHADLRGLVSALPQLRAVAFNGGKAARDGRRLLDRVPGLTLIDLPSSSPAHARLLSEKAAAWSILRSYLPDTLPDRS